MWRDWRREVLWSPWDEIGLEHFRLYQVQDGLVADGFLIRFEEGQPYRLSYQVTCDANWQVRHLIVNLDRGDTERIEFHSDGEGHWEREDGTKIAELDGCIDIDLSFTPFTNTLPIRRLGLKPGETRDIQVVYITLPDLDFSRAHQRYTRLEARDGIDFYRYEDHSIPGGFTAELPIDADGLVLDYPGLFKRVKREEK